MVAPGTPVGAIAEALGAAGVIEDPLVFRMGVRAEGLARELKAGEYRFEAALSPREVARKLARGETVVRRLSVPEGATSLAVVAALEAAEGLSGPTPPVPPEGSLLPETYHYALGDTRAQMLGRMSNAQKELLAELWAERAPDLPFEDPREAVVLASIVERETGLDEERALVASVFVNRLKQGMRLQADPTVVYGLSEGSGTLGRPLTRKDLNTPGPFNTYLIEGLPPTPIANPGRAALEATLNPAESGYLYFVADGEGGHAFAETLEEHNRNVQAWRDKRQ